MQTIRSVCLLACLSALPLATRFVSPPHAQAQAEPTPCRVAQPGLRLGALAGRWPQSNSPLLLFLAVTLPGSHSVVVQPRHGMKGDEGERDTDAEGRQRAQPSYIGLADSRRRSYCGVRNSYLLCTTTFRLQQQHIEDRDRILDGVN